MYNDTVVCPLPLASEDGVIGEESLLILTGTELLTNNLRFKQYSAWAGQVVFHILITFEHALEITCIKQRISAH